MNYRRIYAELIEKRQKDIPSSGEKHHIIPRCLGGSDEKNNIVLLTWREHFIAHRLLAAMYPDNDKLKYAVAMMVVVQKDKTRQPNSRDVATARQYRAAAAKQRRFNPGHTEASRRRARHRMLTNNPIRNDPSKNHTAHPVVVKYEDGSEIMYEYAKLIPIPYGTVKWLRKHNCGSKKHGIISITRV